MSNGLFVVGRFAVAKQLLNREPQPLVPRVTVQAAMPELVNRAFVQDPQAQVECPFHQALFDLRDGSVQCGPATEPVTSWPVKIENGRVYLAL